MSTARIPFTPEDEGAIRTLSGTMLFLLGLNFLFGAIGLLGGCLSFLGVPAQVAIHPMAGVAAVLTAMTVTVYCAGMVAQAALLWQTRSALDQVVTTDTDDQAHLGVAFAKLRLFFGLEAALFVVLMGMQCGGFLTQAFGAVGQIAQMGGQL